MNHLKSFRRAAAWVLIFIYSAVARANTLSYTAVLSGPNEAPPNSSQATGMAKIDYDDVAHALFFDVTFVDLLGTSTAAHIHSATGSIGIGTAQVATIVPTLPNFPTGVQSASYQFTLDLTLAQSFNPAFVTAQGGTALGAELALAQGLAAGQAYFDVASTEFPGGEIRGFLFPVPDTGHTAMLLALGVGGLMCLRKFSSSPTR